MGRYIRIFFLFLVMAGCGSERVEKPQLNGRGPLAIVLEGNGSAPNYHNPMEWWKRNHMEAIRLGDYSQRECMLCHQVETSCNNCHRYVGVQAMESFE